MALRALILEMVTFARSLYDHVFNFLQMAELQFNSLITNLFIIYPTKTGKGDELFISDELESVDAGKTIL